ncbi:MAG: DUF4157 domain-containing protein [Myxococcota bacterium]
MNRALSVRRRPSSEPAPELAHQPSVSPFHQQFGNAEALDAAAGGALAPELWGSLAEGAGMPQESRLLREALGGGGAPSTDRPSAVGGDPLPEVVRARMEAAFGHDFGHVRLHRGAGAHAAAQRLDAAAMAVGSHLFFGPGAWAPGTADGDRRIAHELAHVVQFDLGQVPADGGVSSPDDPLERGAEVAARAATGALGREEPAPVAAPRSSAAARALCDRYPHSDDALGEYAEGLTDLGLRDREAATHTTTR